jgi:hypothetical protein
MRATLTGDTSALETTFDLKAGRLTDLILFNLLKIFFCLISYLTNPETDFHTK